MDTTKTAVSVFHGSCTGSVRTALRTIMRVYHNSYKYSLWFWKNNWIFDYLASSCAHKKYLERESALNWYAKSIQAGRVPNCTGTWRKLSPEVRRNHSLYVLKYGTMQLMKIFVCTSQSIQKRCVKRSTTTNIQNSSAPRAAKNRQCLRKETLAMLCLLYKTLAMLCLLIRLNTTSLGLFLMCPLFALWLQVVLGPAHAVQIIGALLESYSTKIAYR
jgi:hypothetical protein